MATISITSMTKFDLDESEQLSGQLLTTQNKQVYQNILAELCEERLTLKFDTSKPQEFIQNEAYIQGKINIIQYILALSAQVETEFVL